MNRESPAPDLDTGLAFWGANMSRLVDAGMKWPGFSYTIEEMSRLRALGAPVGMLKYQVFTWVTAAIFIVIAACGVGLMFWAMLAAYPDPSKTPASVFVATLACVALVSIGWGVPVSMRLAARIVAPHVDFSTLVPAEGDGALARKVRFQIWRMTAIMCGVFIPGTLLWIAWDLQAGPIVTVLKLVAVAVMMLSMWTARRRPTGS